MYSEKVPYRPNFGKYLYCGVNLLLLHYQQSVRIKRKRSIILEKALFSAIKSNFSAVIERNHTRRVRTVGLNKIRARIVVRWDYSG